MTKFLNNYEHLLRDYSITNYLDNSLKTTLVDEIKNMIYIFNKTIPDKKKITISEDFPPDELIKIMKPYLRLQLITDYSLIKHNRMSAKKKLYKKLCQFQQFNPAFGRKIFRNKRIIQDGKIKRVKSYIEFNMKHKKFNTYEIENFMKSHLEYKYEDNNIEDEDSSSSNSSEDDDSDIPDLVTVTSEDDNNSEYNNSEVYDNIPALIYNFFTFNHDTLVVVNEENVTQNNEENVTQNNG